ncbi:MAG: hypothetical protein J4400_05445 [Candidatus Aenigmarchaeota archaeon]|nr:hypothetical protein [Candidatus Aenigmarchaeota archaeon]
MTYCIIVRGPLGVGETTIAKRIAERTGRKYVSVDEILRRNNLDNVKDGNIPLRNFIRANEIIAKKYPGKPLIIDGNFYYVCIDRDKKRKLSYGKESASAVYKLVFKFDHGTVINAENKNPEKVAEKILTLLKK